MLVLHELLRSRPLPTQPNTHVISSIVHIAHEYDNDDEPWPIEIEDHDGVLHAVNLEAGQVRFHFSTSLWVVVLLFGDLISMFF